MFLEVPFVVNTVRENVYPPGRGRKKKDVVIRLQDLTGAEQLSFSYWIAGPITSLTSADR